MELEHDVARTIGSNDLHAVPNATWEEHHASAAEFASADLHAPRKDDYATSWLSAWLA